MPTRNKTSRGDPTEPSGARYGTPRTGLVPRPGSAGAPLTPEQKRFRKLSGQVNAARESLERFKQQARDHGQQQAQRRRPLVADLLRCGEGLLRAMDAFEDAQRLSPAQRRTLHRCIAERAVALIGRLDGPPPDWLVEIHDRHARKTHAQQVREDRLSMQARLSEALGVDLGDEPLTEAELAARLARERATATDTAAAQPQAAQAVAFTQSVREVYRKLASALHPDRIPEGAERDAMTALMQQANEAYEAQDLLKLLDLQARLDHQASGDAAQRVMGLSAATLRHYSQRLEQELVELRSALSIEQDHLLASHPGLAPYLLGRTDGQTREEMLSRAAQDELRALQLEIEEAKDSLNALSNAASGRRWIAQQRQRQREDDENARFDGFFSGSWDP
ncbi:MAG: J domain-containing protein [Rubrivivax sp.]